MELNVEKISLAMRSLFRFYQLTEMAAPEILIETEREILKKNFDHLNADEIYAVVTNWEDYNTKQQTEQSVQDINCESDIDSGMRRLN